MGREDIAIVGGGIVGASVAYHLSERTDRSITLYERQSLASETTTKSAAFVGYYGGESDVRARMKRYGIALYNELLADAKSQATTHTAGRLSVATTDEGAAALREAARRERDSAAEAVVQYFSGGELPGAILAPDLNYEAIRGATYRPNIAYTRPAELTLEFVRRAEANGVDVRVNTEVTAVRVADGRVDGVETERGSVRYGSVVCAAGPWNPALARTAGVDLPLEHSLGSVLLLCPSEPFRDTVPSIKHEESGVYVRHHHGGRLFLGHRPERSRERDPDRVGERVDADLLRTVADVLPSILPALEDAAIEEEWVGVRTATPDENPILGCTAVEGLYATGFNGDGIMLAPAAGRIIASQILDDDPTECYPDVAISRFDGYEDVYSS